jgi:hypothetical protein
MTRSPVTIVEFLEARLTEDEDRADGWDQYLPITHRAHAEVDAKRAILVEWLRIDSRSHQSAANYSAWVAGEREPHPGVTSPDDCERARLETLGLALHALA